MFSNNAFEFADNETPSYNYAQEMRTVQNKQKDSVKKPAQTNGVIKEMNGNTTDKTKRKRSDIYKATSEGLLSVVKSLIIGDESIIHESDGDGLYPIHIAAKHNRSQVVNILLDYGAESNVVTTGCGLAPLHIACRFNSAEAARVLLDRGADPNLTPTSSGNAPLHICARFNSVDVMRLLLAKSNIDIEARDLFLMASPLHIACGFANLESVKLLMSHGASLDVIALSDYHLLHTAIHGGNLRVISAVIDAEIQRCFLSPVNIFISSEATTNKKFQNFMDAKNEHGDTALHLAVKQGSFDQVKLLIHHNATINSVNQANQTPLHFAAMCGGAETVELLLTKQATTNCQDTDLKTPLHYAASIGNSDAVKHLWNHGAKVDVKDVHKLTPLLYAITAGQFDCACRLVDYGADILTLDNNGRTCLHLAVENEHEDLVAFLLEKKAGKQLINKYEPEKERTPLHYAALGGNIKIVELLLKNKPITSKKDVNRKTALHLATEIGKNRVVEILARAGITAVFEADDMLRTPLHYAAMGKRRKICANLLRYGAEVDQPDINRWTPLMWAVKSGDVETVLLLLDFNAQISCLDNKGNSLLHVACSNNQVDVAKLLLDNGIEFTLNNNHMNCLDCAVEQQHSDVVMAIVKHKRWEDVFHIGIGIQNPMTTLIQRFPEAAEVVMDRCVKRRLTLKGKATQIESSYNFRYLDPGPHDISGPDRGRYIALIDMVRFKRQDLLTHPLAKKLLNYKWNKFGRLIYFFNIFVYSVFLAMLTGFIMPERKGASIGPGQGPGNSTVQDVVHKRNPLDKVIPVIIGAFSLFHLLKELYQMYLLKIRYFKDFTNLVEWCLYLSTCAFVAPFVFDDNEFFIENRKMFWQMGAVAVFLGFSNFILFLRVLSHVGLYVTMYLEVVKTLIKVMCLFAIFILNFAVVFYILFKEEAAFETFFKSIVKTTVMTIGELDYATLLVDGLNQKNEVTQEPYVPFPDLSFIFFYLFLLACPIVLMNLLIGLAVGDIESIQQTAFLTNKKMKIDFVSEVEGKFPKFITNRLYEPNITATSRTKRKIKMFTNSIESSKLLEDGDAGDDDDIREDPTTTQFREVKKELLKTRQQMKTLSSRFEKQQELIVALAKKNGIAVSGSQRDNRRNIRLF